MPCCRAVTTAGVRGEQVSSTPGLLGQSWVQALGIIMVQTSCAVFINVKKKCLNFLMNEIQQVFF